MKKNSVKGKGNECVHRQRAFEQEFINLERAHDLVNSYEPFSPPLA